MKSTMDALVFMRPGDYSIEKVPIPIESPGGFLLKVYACALCGSDLRTLRSGHRRITPPLVLGHEMAGIVERLGPQYHGPLKVGDNVAVSPPVYCGECEYCQDGRFELCENLVEMAQKWPGSFAEFVAIPEEAIPLSIRNLPQDMNLIHAAVSEPIAACVNAQEIGKINLGDTVAIIGAGPVGCIHSALAKLKGASKVIIADISPERLEISRGFFPDHTIDVNEKNIIEEVRELTDGKGAEVVITANPVPQTQIQAVEMCKKGGRILIFGGLPKNNNKPGIDMNIVHYNGLQIYGTTSFAPRHHELAIKLMYQYKIPVDRFVTIFKLSEFENGSRLALDGKITKAVFIPDEEFIERKSSLEKK